MNNANKSDTKRLAQNISVFSLATLISRILGYVRDALVASTFGGGALTDAFYAAFRVPNLLRRFVGEGAMTAAFIPVFTEVERKEGKSEANRLFNSIFFGLIVFLAGVVVLGIFFAPTLAKLVAWGFEKDPAKLALTTDLIRLTLPFLIVISLAALVTAVLNASISFFTPALAPSGLSIAEILFILAFAALMPNPIYGLAMSAVVGGALHLVWQLPGLYKKGFKIKPTIPFSHPQVKTFFILIGPTILGLGADQINAFVDQLCASFLQNGAITALYNSNRVMQLPLALFGIAVSSVALPTLSKAAANGDHQDFRELLNYSLRIANFILIPSMVGLVVLGPPMIQLLFEHGKFTADYSRLTFLALAPYALGLPAYSAVRILASAFYAHKDTQTPVRISIWGMILHVICSLMLMWKFHVFGLALSTALSAWFQAFCLFLALRKKIGLMGGQTIMKSFAFGSIAGLIMGIICYGGHAWILKAFPLPIQVLTLITVGMAFYFGMARLFKMDEMRMFMDLLKNRKFQIQSRAG